MVKNYNWQTFHGNGQFFFVIWLDAGSFVADGIIFFIFHHLQRWCGHIKSMINIQPWNSSDMMPFGLLWELFVHLYLKYHIFIYHRIRKWMTFSRIWCPLYLGIVPITKIFWKSIFEKFHWVNLRTQLQTTDLIWIFFGTHIREPHDYFRHRLFHPWRISWLPDYGRILYKYIHKLHHKSYNTTAFSGTSMHPIEVTIFYSVKGLKITSNGLK